MSECHLHATRNANDKRLTELQAVSSDEQNALFLIYYYYVLHIIIINYN
jgi:hypothetical protein